MCQAIWTSNACCFYLADLTGHRTTAALALVYYLAGVALAERVDSICDETSPINGGGLDGHNHGDWVWNVQAVRRRKSGASTGTGRQSRVRTTRAAGNRPAEVERDSEQKTKSDEGVRQVGQLRPGTRAYCGRGGGGEGPPCGGTTSEQKTNKAEVERSMTKKKPVKYLFSGLRHVHINRARKELPSAPA